MMKALVPLALCLVLSVSSLGCENRKPDSTPSRSTNYGCMARESSVWHGKTGKNPKIYPSKAPSRSDAIDEAKANYHDDHPDVSMSDIDVNCWACSTPNLGPQERDVCDF